MANIIDLSFDNDDSSISTTSNNMSFGSSGNVISLLDDSQEQNNDGANNIIVNTDGLSRREARKRRRLAKENAESSSSSSSSTTTTTTTSALSPNKKKKIKTANNNVEEISKKIKELRNELVKAEKELDIAVGKKVRANTNDTLGDDGSMSIENANILEELKETLSCSICLDAYSQKNNIWSTGCGHLYHKRCINACINVSKIRYSPKPTPGSRSHH